jgi:hypothetical protein
MTAKLCADLLAQHDLPGLLRDIERAHAAGPILDPTLYRDKAKAMDEDAELLRAALKLRAFGGTPELAKIPHSSTTPGIHDRE